MFVLVGSWFSDSYSFGVQNLAWRTKPERNFILVGIMKCVSKAWVRTRFCTTVIEDFCESSNELRIAFWFQMLEQKLRMSLEVLEVSFRARWKKKLRILLILQTTSRSSARSTRSARTRGARTRRRSRSTLRRSPWGRCTSAWTPTTTRRRNSTSCALTLIFN